MSRRQDPRDPDAILPVGHVSSAAHAARRSPQEEHPPQTVTQKTLQGLVEEISKHALDRGERSYEWRRSILGLLPDADLKKTWMNLHRLKIRLSRGEFLCTFDASKRRTSAIRDCFAPSKVVVLTGQESPIIAESVRPDPLTSHPNPILPEKIYGNASVKTPDRFNPEEFQAAIQSIATWYGWRNPHASEEAQHWQNGALRIYGRTGGVRWRATPGHKDGRLVRFDLIKAAIAVANGHGLPDVDQIVNGDVPFLENVPSSSHSLARISRRQARRVGYHGPEAQDGGLEFRRFPF
ncbi:hypothetical protein JCM11491_003942 [Sporobolomyces phaffii]